MYNSYNRQFQLPQRKSFFLFGARQTGKSTLLDKLLQKKEVLKFDFLEAASQLRYTTQPDLFYLEVEKFIKTAKQPVIFVDEVQKVPAILDQVHRHLYKNPQVQFILTGSSARKLRRSGANMLAGRAWEYNLFPLTHLELADDFELNKVLGRGSLPPVFQFDEAEATQFLQSYVSVYLKEEILDEALVRNIAPFNRFLEIAADENGNLINHSNISNDVGVVSKTIQDYYQILEDTLIATRVLPYLKGSERKRVSRQSRYYFFDVGVVNALCKRSGGDAQSGTRLYGRQFEHFVFLEIKRHHAYHGNKVSLFHWRDNNEREVDVVMEFADKLVAVEIKAKEHVSSDDLKGLKTFSKLYSSARLVCLCLTPRPYEVDGVEVVHWKELGNLG